MRNFISLCLSVCLLAALTNVAPSAQQFPFSYWKTSGPVYDPDAQNYFDKIALAGSTIDLTAKTAVNDFVVGCKADSIWTLLLDVGPFCGSDLTAASVKLKKLSTAWTYTLVGGISYSQSAGINGNNGGTSDYIRCGFNGTDLTSGSSGIGIYDIASANGLANICGAINGSDRLVFYYCHSDNKAYSDQYNAGNEIASGSAFSGTVGFVFTSRLDTASPKHVLYRNGSSVGSSSTVGGNLPSTEVFLLGFSSSGFPSTNGAGPHKIGFACFTLGMTASEVGLLNTRVHTLQTALGR